MTENVQPWYKQFWPWFLLALPGAAVIASMHMLFVAAKGADQLVRQDYYKEGLAINERIAQVNRAKELGVQLRMSFVADTGSINLASSKLDKEMPLTVEIIHPHYQQSDQVITLKSLDGLNWRGDLSALPEGRRYIWVYQGDQWMVKGEFNFKPEKGELVWVNTNP